MCPSASSSLNTTVVNEARFQTWPSLLAQPELPEAQATPGEPPYAATRLEPPIWAGSFGHGDSKQSLS